MGSRAVVPFRCVPFLRTRQAAGLRFTNFSFFGIPRRGFLLRDFVRLVRRRGHCLSFGRRRRRRPLSSQLNIMAFISTRASDEEFRGETWNYNRGIIFRRKATNVQINGRQSYLYRHRLFIRSASEFSLDLLTICAQTFSKRIKFRAATVPETPPKVSSFRFVKSSYSVKSVDSVIVAVNVIIDIDYG